jgi:hypothetical protein
MPTSNVIMPTAATYQLIAQKCVAKKYTVSANDIPRSIGIPKKCWIWLDAIRSPAPAVKPTTTVCEMKFTSTPMRPSPIAS